MRIVGRIANDNNADLYGPPQVPAHLFLTGSTITRNSLRAGRPNITVRGGGVYDDTSQGATVNATNSLIAQNTPDQCFGC